MFETLFRFQSTIARHRSAPFAAERQRYLRHCAATGATDLSQRHRARAMYWVAPHLSAEDAKGVDAQRLRHLIDAHHPRPSAATAASLFNANRPWLKFLGWWRQPASLAVVAGELDEFVRWMRDERGLAPCTIEQWRYRTENFLRWCAQTGRRLPTLEPTDIDAYFLTYGADRWSRVSARHIANMLRVFLRHAATTGAWVSGRHGTGRR